MGMYVDCLPTILIVSSSGN
jgi:hypothetical protein